MPTIDADAHVIESEHTWDFIDESDSKFRPQLDPLRKYWIIDNNKFSRGTSNKALPEASRDSRDVAISKALHEKFYARRPPLRGLPDR